MSLIKMVLEKVLYNGSQLHSSEFRVTAQFPFLYGGAVDVLLIGKMTYLILCIIVFPCKLPN
jgi:hypothetical protein